METYYQKEIQLELINSFVPCQYYHHLTSWDWRWGETPLFKTQFGAYEISIKKGTFITINDDEIQQRLVGLKLLKENLEQARHSCEHFPTLRVIDYLLTLVID